MQGAGPMDVAEAVSCGADANEVVGRGADATGETVAGPTGAGGSEPTDEL
jgi:hypothetical protein